MMSNPVFSRGNVLPQLPEKYFSDFNLLYDTYAPAMYGVIKSIVSDEQKAGAILQQAFLKIWQQRAGYNPQKTRLFTWLYQITYSTAKGYKG